MTGVLVLDSTHSCFPQLRSISSEDFSMYVVYELAKLQ